MIFFNIFIALRNTKIYHNSVLVYSDTITEFEVLDDCSYPSIRKIGNNRFEIITYS